MVEAYRDATNKPYGYLILDVSPSSSSDLQMRTNLFPDESLLWFISDLIQPIQLVAVVVV